MKRQRWLKKCQKNGWAVPETEYPNSLAATSGKKRSSPDEIS
jgi:hypothetical protein